MELPENDPRIAALWERDYARIVEGAKMYGPSWKTRGGAGAYMVMIRKWDRLQVQLQRSGYIWAKAIERDQRAEGITDDIRDLRCYLIMALSEVHRFPTTAPGNTLDYLEVVYDEITIRCAEAPAMSVQGIAGAMHTLDHAVRQYDWDIFRYLRDPDTGSDARAFVRTVVRALYLVDADNPTADVVKGAPNAEGEGFDCVIGVLQSGDHLLLPLEMREKLPHELTRFYTLEGALVQCAPGAVLALIDGYQARFET